MTNSNSEAKPVLFIHGGGDGGYEADAPLADSLQRELGPAYGVRAPRMPEDSTPDFGWGAKIGSEIGATKGELLLVGHSLGASMLLKYLAEHKIADRIGGIFLLATPFWKGDEDWQKGLVLPDRFAEALSEDVPLFLYHCEDDEEIGVSHLDIYIDKLPWATVRRLESGGHQFGEDLSLVARDIRDLE